jgi:hypothetical protein
MYTNTTSRRGRYSARAAAIATIAIIFGAAACGTETASDNGEPAAPAAPAAQPQATPHPPTSADNAERQGAARPQAKYRRQSTHPGTGREIPIP